jgi:hypothetical protein
VSGGTSAAASAVGTRVGGEIGKVGTRVGGEIGKGAEQGIFVLRGALEAAAEECGARFFALRLWLWLWLFVFLPFRPGQLATGMDGRPAKQGIGNAGRDVWDSVGRPPFIDPH